MFLSMASRIPACKQGGRVPCREMGRINRGAPVCSIPSHPIAAPGHEEARMGPHHQLSIGAQCPGIAVQSWIRIGQAWTCGVNQGLLAEFQRECEGITLQTPPFRELVWSARTSEVQKISVG